MKLRKLLEPLLALMNQIEFQEEDQLKALWFYFGGETGIGKSTLILQICDKIKGEGKVLYVAGEESAEQIKMRADRLGINQLK